MSDGRASRAGDDRPDLKWVVEWLVEREGQRKTAALLGVNRKTVALALRRERLTDRMNLARPAAHGQPGRSRVGEDDTGRQVEARIQVALEVADELAALVEHLTQRVEALEAAQKARRRRRGPGAGGCARVGGAGPASVQLEAEASATGRGKERWMSRSAG